MYFCSLLLAGLLISCGGPKQYLWEYRNPKTPTAKKTFVELTPIDSLIVSSPNLKIIAADQSFTFVSGIRYPTPYNYSKGYFYGNVSGDYTIALAWGAKKIIVYHKDKPTSPLYGVLYFGSVPFLLKNKPNNGLSIHSIDIPSETIGNAEAGSVSFCGHKAVFDQQTWFNNNEPINEVYTWIVWLSSKPF